MSTDYRVTPFMATTREMYRTTPTASGVTTEAGLAAGGDREAFERLYRTHVDRIFALCARMVGDRRRAEELTQDAFIRAWEKLSLFRGESSFGTWLHRLAVNVVLNARKRDAHRERAHISLDEHSDDGSEWGADSPLADESPARAAGEWADVETAIRNLPPTLRGVFVLHDVEGYQHNEIATLLGIAVGNSKSRLHRARLALRRGLDPNVDRPRPLRRCRPAHPGGNRVTDCRGRPGRSRSGYPWGMTWRDRTCRRSARARQRGSPREDPLMALPASPG